MAAGPGAHRKLRRGGLARWQDDCDHETHRKLAEIYLADNRMARG
jgi:hypothetical protein